MYVGTFCADSTLRSTNFLSMILSVCIWILQIHVKSFLLPFYWPIICERQRLWMVKEGRKRLVVAIDLILWARSPEAKGRKKTLSFQQFHQLSPSSVNRICHLQDDKEDWYSKAFDWIVSFVNCLKSTCHVLCVLGQWFASWLGWNAHSAKCRAHGHSCIEVTQQEVQRQDSGWMQHLSHFCRTQFSLISALLSLLPVFIFGVLFGGCISDSPRFRIKGKVFALVSIKF